MPRGASQWAIGILEHAAGQREHDQESTLKHLIQFRIPKSLCTQITTTKAIHLLSNHHHNCRDLQSTVSSSFISLEFKGRQLEQDAPNLTLEVEKELAHGDDSSLDDFTENSGNSSVESAARIAFL
ncbi:hypothetical protein PtA15_4A250 [Puccinia triticina]|uniref:Uncharacterized protein n=1 Tax=Puccinia triticina TaxID=208348 RepID=A0ABY7CI49_9BASI|nr:uncharacterized protein PtA15_4A250 [Puccinia triticina]WAQ83801.1 hypothetical protein PtA15_4A250 [Puccinia triticina]WAR54643.1 hypothetical protein PtB15_4B260 [Puccinia triticina]